MRSHPRSGPGPHDGGVHRDEEIARGACAQLVLELDAHRLVPRGDDQGSQVMVEIPGS